jgi:hypothetical protein
LQSNIPQSSVAPQKPINYYEEFSKYRDEITRRVLRKLDGNLQQLTKDGLEEFTKQKADFYAKRMNQEIISQPPINITYKKHEEIKIPLPKPLPILTFSTEVKITIKGIEKPKIEAPPVQFSPAHLSPAQVARVEEEAKIEVKKEMPSPKPDGIAGLDSPINVANSVIIPPLVANIPKEEKKEPIIIAKPPEVEKPKEVKQELTNTKNNPFLNCNPAAIKSSSYTFGSAPSAPQVSFGPASAIQQQQTTFVPASTIQQQTTFHPPVTQISAVSYQPGPMHAQEEGTCFAE